MTGYPWPLLAALEGEGFDRERTAEILTTLRVLLCNEVVFGLKYRALHFYKSELERKLARLMNGYTGCTGYAAKLFYLCVYDFNDAFYRSDGMENLSCGLVNLQVRVPLYRSIDNLLQLFFLEPCGPTRAMAS